MKVKIRENGPIDALDLSDSQINPFIANITLHMVVWRTVDLLPK